MALDLSQQQKLSQRISPQQLLRIGVLQKSLPELRAELVAEISRNPAIEDFDHPLETSLSTQQQEHAESNAEGDYPADDFVPGTNRDEEYAERRQAFFDKQVKTETLQEHLLEQLPLSDIPRADWQLVEVLVGDLDDRGYYRGSAPDLAMAFGKTIPEIDVIRGQIMEFDPPGCGAVDLRECLLAQLDSIEEAGMRTIVRGMVEKHLENIAQGRLATIEKDLGIDRAGYVSALKALRTLDARPGRQFPGEHERVEYVNPEIHAVREGGRWVARMDARSVPEIRLSQRFQAYLKDPNQTAETKAYVRERIAAAQAFREAIVRRQETVQAIADAIFERQQAFFDEGFRALKPLTELEVAEKVGVNGATVSRTVRDKYAATPQGTIELRKFFATGVRTGDGEEMISQVAVLEALKKIVDEEDRTCPLSDEKIAVKLKEAGFTVARRTVAKYRDKLSIPGTSGRRR